MTNLPIAKPFQISLKIIAALLGGYVFTVAFVSLIAVIWPARLADAMQTGLMLSFAVYSGAMLWAFSQANWQRAWLVMMIPAAMMWGMTLWLS
ncbi:MAG: hypothetical protein R3341_04415 [Methylophaga sp.]|nr:hypothetical protein [Methylophaga sp.]